VFELGAGANRSAILTTEPAVGATMRAMRLAAIAAVLVCATRVAAQDHLEPETSVLGGDTDQAYNEIVVGVLRDAYAIDVVARMVVLPPNGPEIAVGVKKDEDRYAIFVLVPAIPLNRYATLSIFENEVDEKGNPIRDDKSIAELRKSLPADWHDVKVNRCVVAIDKALGERLVNVWGKMLMQTRYPEPGGIETIFVDGTQFHFYGYGKAGQTWNPAGGETGAFVEIGYAMADYCGDKRAPTLATLSAKVDKLLARIGP
jgi:hypothetical protein